MVLDNRISSSVIKRNLIKPVETRPIYRTDNGVVVAVIVIDVACL